MTTNMRNLSLGLGAAAASSLVMFVAAPAQATSFTLGDVTATFLGESCITANCVNLAAGGYDVDGGGVLFGDDLPVALTPGSDSGNEGSVTSYSATASGGTTDQAQIANNGMDSKITVNNLNGLFEIYWGSIDAHNIIDFYNGDTITTITGSQIASAFFGLTDPKNAQGNFGVDAYISFTGTFDKAVLSTSKVSAEGDNIGNGISFEVATAVPEPTAVLSLLAVGAIAGGSTLKRKR